MNKLLLNIALALIISLPACTSDFSPKPKGFPRIDFPAKNYQLLETDCPFTFNYLKTSKITSADNTNEPCWFNIDYPYLKSRIHISYKPIEGNLNKFIEDSRTLVYKHTVKASAIHQNDIYDENRKVYAKVYEIEGDVASSVQFYATDSLNHFLRGALYFNAAANADSLQPAIDFITQDVNELIRSLEWTKPGS